MFFVKAIIAGLTVALASTLSKRSPGLGALIVSLPLVSLLTMIFIWWDGGGETRIADHSTATFWLVLPTLPMFLLLPWLMKHIPFLPALGLCIVITAGLYLAAAAILRQFGISI